MTLTASVILPPFLFIYENALAAVLADDDARDLGAFYHRRADGCLGARVTHENVGELDLVAGIADEFLDDQGHALADSVLFSACSYDCVCHVWLLESGQLWPAQPQKSTRTAAGAGPSAGFPEGIAAVRLEKLPRRGRVADVQSRVVIVMAKEPRAARVKTRLCPPLAAEEAARLYEAFVADTLDAVSSPGHCLRVYGADPPMARLAVLAAAVGAELALQCGGDLGRRMAVAMAAELARAERGVVVGADSPDMPTERIAEAFAALDSVDVCIGPATDGGYYLLAAKRRVPVEALGADIPWSTDKVLEATRERLCSAGINHTELDYWRDIDDYGDLERLMAALADSGTPALSRTRAMLGGLMQEGRLG
jgi:rSAM/selenodomain-associated transferase 1